MRGYRRGAGPVRRRRNVSRLACLPFRDGLRAAAARAPRPAGPQRGLEHRAWPGADHRGAGGRHRAAGGAPARPGHADHANNCGTPANPASRRKARCATPLITDLRLPYRDETDVIMAKIRGEWPEWAQDTGP